MHAYFTVMQRYVRFRGRASRAEFWQFSGIYMVGVFVVVILDQVLVPPGRPGAGLLTALYGLFHALPGTAVLVRRLHDTDRSGWWVLINLTGIGSFVLLAFAMLRGTPGPNRHGPPPVWPEGEMEHAASGLDSQGRHIGTAGFVGRVEPRLGTQTGFAATSTAPASGTAVSEALRADGGQSRDIVADLDRLATLHAQGRLSDAEFEAMKMRVIGR